MVLLKDTVSLLRKRRNRHRKSRNPRRRPSRAVVLLKDAVNLLRKQRNRHRSQRNLRHKSRNPRRSKRSAVRQRDAVSATR